MTGGLLAILTVLALVGCVFGVIGFALVLLVGQRLEDERDRLERRLEDLERGQDKIVRGLIAAFDGLPGEDEGVE